MIGDYRDLPVGVRLVEDPTGHIHVRPIRVLLHQLHLRIDIQFFAIQVLGLRALDESGWLQMHVSDCSHADHPTQACKHIFDLYSLPLLKQRWGEVETFWSTKEEEEEEEEEHSAQEDANGIIWVQ